MTRNSEIVLQIYSLGCATLNAAVQGASESQLNWQPAAESRSIAEICRYLIRVDGYFLGQMGFDPVSEDPGSHKLSAIQQAMRSLQSQIESLIQENDSDEALRLARQAPQADKSYSLDYVVKHQAQHYLYHAAQIIYLRRAQDRTWQAPQTQWQTAVDQIADYTWKGRSA